MWEAYASTDFKFCIQTFHIPLLFVFLSSPWIWYTLINFAFQALCSPQRKSTHLPCPSFTPTHSCSYFHPKSVPLTVSYTPIHTHMHANTLKSFNILSTVHHLWTQKEHCKSWPWAKSVLFDKKGNMDGTEWDPDTQTHACLLSANTNHKGLSHQ